MEKIWFSKHETDVETFKVLGIAVFSTMSIRGTQWFEMFMKPIWHTQLLAIKVLFAIREQLGNERGDEVGLPVVTSIGMIGLTTGIPRFAGGLRVFGMGNCFESLLGGVTDFVFVFGLSVLGRVEAYGLMAAVSALVVGLGKEADILFGEASILEAAKESVLAAALSFFVRDDTYSLTAPSTCVFIFTSLSEL